MLAAMLGIVSYAVFLVASVVGGASWLAWWIAIAAAAFAGGCSFPASWAGIALVILGVQPFGMLLVGVLSGEFVNPSRSTGGLAGFMIICFLMMPLSPIPLLASACGSWVRRRAERPAGGKLR